MKASKYLETSDIEAMHLDQLKVFDGLSIDDLESLLTVCQYKQYHANDFIIKAGSRDPWLFILLEGKASVMVNNTEVTTMHTRGAFFGETALIDNSVRQADIIAQTALSVIAIDSVLMKEVLCTTNMVFYAHFYKHITSMLSVRLAQTSEELGLVKRAFQQMINGKKLD